ncbi:MAG TPA: PEGA domain-containing protein [Polyangiaceae bacterium]
MRVAAALLVLAALAVAPVAHADGADALIEQGLVLREAGRDAEALDQFKKAYALAPSPRALAQMALAEQALGRWVVAEANLGRALRSVQDPWIMKNRAALDGALVTIARHLGDLEVAGGATGAEVLLDGEGVGTLPLPGPLRAEVGTRTLEIKRDGYYPVSRMVTIANGEPARVSVEMKPRANVGQLPPPPTPPKETPAHDPVDPGRTQRAVGWGLTLAAVPAVGLGVVGVVGRGGEISSYNSDGTCPGADKPAQPPVCQGHIDSADRWKAVSIVGFSLGALLAGTGVVLLLTAPSEKTGAAAFTCGPFGLGAACVGRF